MKFRFGKILCAAMTVGIFLTQPCINIFAEETGTSAQEQKEDAVDSQTSLTEGAADSTEGLTAEEILEAEKKKVYETPADTNSLTGWAEGPNIQALSGCVIDMESGAFLYSKNMDEKLYPASITKLLTVLVALENAELTDTVTFSEDSIAFLEYGDASIGMKAGEEISMEDALYAILLASANEVSYAVAETVGTNNLGGDYSTFIEKMNERAKELGCTNSSWMNPNGLHNEEHYTTAHDMALIAAEVYKHEEFRTIMEEYEHRIGFTNITQEERVFQQNHKMLWNGNQYSWELATGGKTGYTDQARTTLVTMAEEGDLKLACVVLKDYGGVSYEDTRAMLEYGFANFTKVLLAEQELSEEIESLTNEDAYVLLPEGVDFTEVECEVMQKEESETVQKEESEAIQKEKSEAAQKEEDIETTAEARKVETQNARIGMALFTYEDQVVGTTEVILSDAFFERTGSADATISVDAEDAATNENVVIKTIFTVLIAGMTIIIGVVAIIFIRNYRILQARKRRRRERKRRKRN